MYSHSMDLMWCSLTVPRLSNTALEIAFFERTFWLYICLETFQSSPYFIDFSIARPSWHCLIEWLIDWFITKFAACRMPVWTGTPKNSGNRKSMIWRKIVLDAAVATLYAVGNIRICHSVNLPCDVTETLSAVNLTLHRPIGLMGW